MRYLCPKNCALLRLKERTRADLNGIAFYSDSIGLEDKFANYATMIRRGNYILIKIPIIFDDVEFEY